MTVTDKEGRRGLDLQASTHARRLERLLDLAHNEVCLCRVVHSIFPFSSSLLYRSRHFPRW